MAMMTFTTISNDRIWIESQDIVTVRMVDDFNCRLAMASGNSYYVPKVVYEAEYQRVFPFSAPKKVQ